MRALVFAVALLTTPAFAQAPPEPTALPTGSRIRIMILNPNPSLRKAEPSNGIGTVHRADADSIAFQLDGSDAVRVVPWGQVQELYLSGGTQRLTVGERLLFPAVLTLLGALGGYEWWHTCNDPESDAIWSCIVAPRRLGTSVRFGSWTGFTIGTLAALGIRNSEQWRPVISRGAPRLLIGHDARSGLQLGVTFRF